MNRMQESGYPKDGSQRGRIDAGEWWVDDLGRWHGVDPLSPCARERQPIRETTTQLGLAYRLLGMVRVRASARLVTIDWDVREVHAGALVQAERHLGRLARSPSMAAVPIRLNFYFGGWASETLPGPAAAARRLRQLQCYRGAEPMPAPVLRQRRLSEVGRAGTLLRCGIAAWRTARDGDDALAVLERAGLLDSSLVFSRREGDSRLIYLHVGTRSLLTSLFGVDTAHNLLGQPSERGPAYPATHRRIVAGFGQVLDAGAPRFDHVRTPVQIDGQEPSWIGYERLLLPMPLRRGDRLLISLCDRNDAITVPFMAARTPSA